MQKLWQMSNLVIPFRLHSTHKKCTDNLTFPIYQTSSQIFTEEKSNALWLDFNRKADFGSDRIQKVFKTASTSSAQLKKLNLSEQVTKTK